MFQSERKKEKKILLFCLPADLESTDRLGGAEGGSKGGYMSKKTVCAVCGREALTQLTALPESGPPYQIDVCRRCRDFLVVDGVYKPSYLHQFVEAARRKREAV